MVCSIKELYLLLYKMKPLFQFSCLMEKTSLTEEDVAEGVDEILMNADKALCEELSTESSVRVSVLFSTFFYTWSVFQCAFPLLSKGTNPQVFSRGALFCAISDVWEKQSSQLLNETFFSLLKEQDDQEREMVCNAFNKAIQSIQREQSMLKAIRQKYELNTQVSLTSSF